jgi:hypothetical protein
LHNEFLQFCRESGIEDIAKHSGIVQNGELPVFKAYSSTTGTSHQCGLGVLRLVLTFHPTV